MAQHGANDKALDLKIGCRSLADSDVDYREFLMEVLRFKFTPAFQYVWVELRLRGPNQDFTSLKISEKLGHGFPHCQVSVSFTVKEGVISVLEVVPRPVYGRWITRFLGFASNGLWDEDD